MYFAIKTAFLQRKLIDINVMSFTSSVLARHRAKILWTASVLIICAAGIYLYILYRESHISTDDAYVTGYVHTIASKVPGTIQTIHVEDNQLVGKDTLLLEIDTRDQDTKVTEADSQLKSERARKDEFEHHIEVTRKQLSEIRYKIEATRANLRLQTANLKQAGLDAQRAEKLIKTDSISRERFEKVLTGYDVALAQVETAKEQVRQAEAGLETQKALIRQAEAAYIAQGSTIRQREAVLNAEQLKKSYTKIYAPSDGYVTKRTVETGNQIHPGQPLMAIVPLDSVWVVANYKETQLRKVRKGQTVRIKVDTYPEKIFFGKVDSIMAGTGSVFSLFPPRTPLEIM